MTIQFYNSASILETLTAPVLDIREEYFVLDLGYPCRFYFDTLTAIGEKPENGKISVLYIH